MIKLIIGFDMRAPEFGADPRALYLAALDQCEWADKMGFECVSLMEHHNTRDGYLPSPLVMGAAIAGRTKQLVIELGVMLLPLYNPLRAAEDLAVLDLVSGGRLRLIAGAGYRPEEFAMLGLDVRKRPSLMARNIEILKKAWTGEPFDYEGQRVQILPRPAQQPRPQILMGGSSKPAAERAAKIADGFVPVAPALYDEYIKACAALGKTAAPRSFPTQKYSFLHVTKDPARDWKRIGRHIMFANNEYASWFKNAARVPYTEVSDPDALLASGHAKILTPDECVELARKDKQLSFQPLTGGLDPEIAWESLSLFEREVLPRIGA